MHTPASLPVQGPHAATNAAPHALSRLSKDEQGATAVEFGIIAVPFVTMLLGIISVCLYFFTVLELENAVWQGSRDVRVGAYGAGTGGYSGKTDAEKKDLLKAAICRRMRAPDCATKIRVLLQSRAAVTSVGAGLQRPDCRATDGTLVSATDAANNMEATGASSFVILTGCYTWDLGGKLPFFKIGNMPDGSFLVQATFAFVNENYN